MTDIPEDMSENDEQTNFYAKVYKRNLKEQLNDFPRMDINTADLLEEVENLLVIAESMKENWIDVNWNDLRVHDITYSLSMLYKDHPYCFVEIEEASPTSQLRSWLQYKLDETGRFPNTFVELEW